MFRMLGRAAQRLLTEISQHRTPEQIAWGLAIGVSFGLVPMDSIISALLLIAILILPVNHLSAAIAFASMALASQFIAPIPNAFGLWILSNQWVVNVLSAIYPLPLVPWLRLNNTMVVGGFCLGILSVAPNYIFLRSLVRRTHSKIQQWSIDDVARRAPEFRKISSEKSARNPGMIPAVTSKHPLAQGFETSQSHRSSTAPILANSTPATQRVAHGSHVESKPVERKAVEAKASDASQLRHGAAASTRHRETSSSVTKNANKTENRDSLSTIPSMSTSAPIQGDTVLRETVIEVVRFREPSESSTADEPIHGIDAHRRTDLSSSVSSTHRIHDFPNQSNALSGPHRTTEIMNQELMIAKKNASLANVSLKTHPGSTMDPGTGAIQTPSPIGLGNHRQAITGHKGSDSLRYLLRHITGTKSEREGTDS